MNQELLARRKQLAADLVEIKARAGRLGLLCTARKLEPGVTEVGWEIARMLDGTQHDLVDAAQDHP